MIELFSTETKPVYIGYNKLAADVAEATTDALTGADYMDCAAGHHQVPLVHGYPAGGRRTARIGGGGHRQRTRRQAGQATQRYTAWF